MNTLGWLFILIAGLIIRGVSKGLGLTEIPKYLGDLATAIITNDTASLSSVIARTGNSQQAAAPADAEGTGMAAYSGTALLAEAKRLGSTASGYKWGATGPDRFDCSGLVWRACKNTGIYTGPRFTSGTFGVVAGARGFGAKVKSPAVGDVVTWPGHMGIVDGPNSFYSALSVRSGIKTMPITGHSGTPTFYRITDTGKLLGVNGRTPSQSGKGSTGDGSLDIGGSLGLGGSSK